MPKKGLTWCTKHKRWGKHTTEECRLKAVRSNAIDTDADTVPVTLASTASQAVTDVKALPDTGSQGCFISKALFDSLATQGMLASGPSDVIMISANKTEDKAVCQVRLNVRSQRPGEIPTFREVAETFQVMETLSYSCVLSKSVSTLLGLGLADSDQAGSFGEALDASDEETPENEVDELYNERTPDLTETVPEVREGVKTLLDEHSALFQPLDTSPADIPAMEIPLTDNAVPIQKKPYWLSPALRKAADEELGRLLELDIIERSTSSWAAGMFFVDQGDKHRMVVDYKPVNACSEPLQVPLPSCNELLSLLRDKRYFATLDLKSGYHQVPVKEEDRPKTAFVTHKGLYQFKRVPFWLMNAPSHFQSAMLTVLDGIVFESCLLYVDDILVFGSSPDDFLENLAKVLKRLDKHGIRLGVSKCHIGRDPVDYLGNRVTREGITIRPERILAISTMRHPSSTTEARSLLGLLSYYRRFIPHFATVVEPIINLTRNGVPFAWTEKEEKAFKTTISLLNSKKLLHHPDYSRELVIQSDASGVGIGGVLLQEKAGESDQAVSFFSRTLNATQRRWTLNEKEAYALYQTVMEFAPFLRGHHFTAETDHQNLTYLTTSISPKVERWKLRISEFNLSIRFIKGEDNVIADALSRVGHIKTIASTAVLVLPQAPVLTDADKAAAIQAAHGNALSGHPGINATINALKEAGHKWPKMTADVTKAVKECPVCQKYRLKSVMAYHAGHLMSSAPFSTISVDSIGPMKAGPDGHAHVLVAVDNFSRWIELIPTVSTDAETCADALMSAIICRHGLPDRIHSDNGTQFVNGIIKGLLKALAINHTRIAPYVPEQNGLVERANASVIKNLRAIMATVKVYDNWPRYIPIVQFIMNNSKHSAIGTTPHAVLYGDHISPPKGLLTRLKEEVEPEDLPMPDYVKLLKQRLKVVTTAATKHQKDVIWSSTYTPKMDVFEPGDLVLVTYAARKKPSKLAPTYLGPFRVTAVSKNRIHSLESLVDDHVLRAHASRLRRFEGTHTKETAKDLAAADAEEHVVERVVSHDSSTGRLRFRLRWQGYDKEDDSFQFYDEDIAGCEAVENYIDSNGLRSQVGEDCGVIATL